MKTFPITFSVDGVDLTPDEEKQIQTILMNGARKLYDFFKQKGGKNLDAVTIHVGENGGDIDSAKTITPSAVAQIASPSAGFAGIRSCTVNATPLEEVNASASAEAAVEVTPSNGKVGLSKVTIAQVQLVDVNANPSAAAAVEVTPTDSAMGMSKVTIAQVTAAIDANIIPGNIKDGVTILGVLGTYDGSPSEPAE